MGKGLHKVFKTFVKQILQDLPPLGESISEVSHFITEPRKFAEVINVSGDMKKPWLNVNIKDIKNRINYQTDLVEEPEKGEPITPCIDLYKAKIQSETS